MFSSHNDLSSNGVLGIKKRNEHFLCARQFNIKKTSKNVYACDDEKKITTKMSSVTLRGAAAVANKEVYC
jgi:hypothetical protein